MKFLKAAYDPPFERTDVLIGQSSYDSVMRLPDALRVLRPKTRLFVHFQDAFPLSPAILSFLNEFPQVRPDWLTDISEKEFNERLEKWAKENDLSGEEGTARQTFFIWLLNHEFKRFAIMKGDLIDLVHEFQARLNFSLEQVGFKIIGTGIAQAAYLGPRLPMHDEIRKSSGENHLINYFVNAACADIAYSHSLVKQFEDALHGNGAILPEFADKPELIEFCRGQGRPFLENVILRYVIAENPDFIG